MIDKSSSDKIEILSADLLKEHRGLVSELKGFARSLGLEFGWHYLLDIVWILSNLDDIAGKQILDAGAGTGIIQWYLAEQGATVVSVDRASRAALPTRYRQRFQVRGLRENDLPSTRQLIASNFHKQSGLRTKIAAQARDLIGLAEHRRSSGQVVIYNQDLVNLIDIKENSFDVVVAVSALEHNPPDQLALVVNELMRVLKPGGLLLATLTAARDQDWYHEPSSGWCYTESSLRRIFKLVQDASANYDQYDNLFTKLRNCKELRNNLAGFYYKSGDNGMPWGIWDPKYQPVGVRKTKKRVPL